ncbi:MAG: C10 family peptidase, partial [Chlamydiia bacterium]|nr:C10 family peptidase [Chlamydiia bacterium]
MLELYQKQIVEIQTKHLKADENIATQWQSLLSANYTEKGVTSVDPLLITTWRQGLYYNTDCPVDAAGPDGHALVGCVATAMSQIMKYHSYPPQGTGSHSYYHEDYGTLSADFGNSTYDWASMPNNASGYNGALALIGSHCGISVDMNYGPNASGASTSFVAIALVNYFDYKTSAQMEWKENYSSAQWDDLLINEINNNRPMEYRGSGPDGGHAFVLDGYQGASNNHFHFNWGWGGSADGYYYLSNLNPGGYTFNDYQGAVIGIEPNGAANYPPIVINPISNVSLDEGFGTHTINISNVFDDVDGDALSYSVVSSNTSVVGVTVSGTTLSIIENTNGSSTITLTASDGNGGSVNDIFSVYVSAVSCDPPVNLTAEDILQDGHTATLNWEVGSSLDEFRYDDGTAIGQLGFETGTTNSVLGSVHPIGAELNEMSWYLTAEGGPHTSVTLYVMGLDANGVPDENNVLFTISVSNTDEVWNTYAFANAVIADDGFFLGVAYDGFVALGTDDGVGAPYTYASNTHYYSSDYTSGAWTAWEDSGFEVNGMIRAMGVAGAVNSYDYASSTTKESSDLEYIAMENPVDTELDQTRDLSGYNVYRDGSKINTSLVSGTTYDDANAAGYHCFKVTAVYSDCGESDFSNEACVDIESNNNPPIVINLISDVELDEGFGAYNIDFSNVFDDADGDVLSYSVSSSNTSVVSVGISSNNVVITEAGVGTATITLTADDGNGGTVDDLFTVSVNAAANNPPVVINPIADVDLDEGFGTYNISFSNVFDDVDGDVLSYTVSSSNTSVVGAGISSNNVVITEAGIGSATITLTADDGNGGTVDDVFTVSVNAAANNPPVVINPISDVDLEEGFGTYNIDFSNVFDDADGDELTYSVSSSNTSVVGVSISGTNVVITEAGIGSATITLTANDGNGGTVADVFIVNVDAAANNPPVVINPIPDVNLDEGFGTYNIDFSNVFDDVDGDVLNYTVSSSSTSVVSASISGNNVVITEAGVGSATITLTADDGNGGAVDDVFSVNVNAAANNPPVVINPISDVEIDEGFGTYNIDFSSVFDDVDGDVLSFSVSSSN